MQRTYTHAFLHIGHIVTYRQFIWWTFNIRLGRSVRYIHKRLRHLWRSPSNGAQVTTETSDRYYRYHNMSYLRMLVEKHDEAEMGFGGANDEN